jgi:ATP-dependent Lhr-like helicase
MGNKKVVGTATGARATPEAWFAGLSWQPFAFQREVWAAFAAGRSGLLHATTGSGKTYAVWLGALLRAQALASAGDALAVSAAPTDASSLKILWLTPMRALANDTARALKPPLQALMPGWAVGQRTGDTPSSERARQDRRLPAALVTTPESLSLLLTRENAALELGGVQTVIVDEWHELIGNKRGVQVQLALARLRRFSPGLVVWGLSATLGNLQEAMQTLMGCAPALAGQPPPCLVQGRTAKQLLIDTLLPSDPGRFSWAGHLGAQMCRPVVEEIERSGTTLVFTNTRSQAEIWYQLLLRERPEWAGVVALHHGSLDKSVREWVELGLKEGRLKAVVATSSLDLGVDFLPVERVLQIGSAKGVARLLQRAGRSGHAPGLPSRITLVPTHMLELVEAAAARRAALAGEVEGRSSPDKPLDVLVQHLVTVALGGGFAAGDVQGSGGFAAAGVQGSGGFAAAGAQGSGGFVAPDVHGSAGLTASDEPGAVEPEPPQPGAPAMLQEVRSTWAYRDLTDAEFAWALNFVSRGGSSLTAYPEYHRVQVVDGVWRVPDRRIAMRHRLQVGTIVSDASMDVRWLAGGQTLGHIEEGFIARLNKGDCFVFAGRVLEFVRTREMAAYVRLARKAKGTVPAWNGSKMPLSNELGASVQRVLDDVAAGAADGPELQAAASMLQAQQRLSRLPASGRLLVERLQTREGHHLFIYPFAGRNVHIGLAQLLAWRLARQAPNTFSLSVNDYGLEIMAAEPIDLAAALAADWLSSEHLLEDVLASLNAGELARRRFREIARVAGLVFGGYPGAPKSMRQLQASSSLFYDVFRNYDPGNQLLAQAQTEVLRQELELQRLQHTLQRLHALPMDLVQLAAASPFAFPLLVERLREQLSTEKLKVRMDRLLADSEAALAAPAVRGRKERRTKA